MFGDDWIGERPIVDMGRLILKWLFRWLTLTVTAVAVATEVSLPSETSIESFDLLTWELLQVTHEETDGWEDVCGVRESFVSRLRGTLSEDDWLEGNGLLTTVDWERGIGTGAIEIEEGIDGREEERGEESEDKNVEDDDTGIGLRIIVGDTAGRAAMGGGRGPEGREEMEGERDGGREWVGRNAGKGLTVGADSEGGNGAKDVGKTPCALSGL